MHSFTDLKYYLSHTTMLCVVSSEIFYLYKLPLMRVSLKSREAWREIKESPTHKTRCNGKQALDDSVTAMFNEDTFEVLKFVIWKRPVNRGYIWVFSANIGDAVFALFHYLSVTSKIVRNISCKNLIIFGFSKTSGVRLMNQHFNTHHR